MKKRGVHNAVVTMLFENYLSLESVPGPKVDAIHLSKNPAAVDSFKPSGRRF